MTAAHCVDRASVVEIIAGAHNISREEEDGQVRMLTSNFIVHEDWDSFLRANDIALVKTPSPLVFNGERHNRLEMKHWKQKETFAQVKF